MFMKLLMNFHLGDYSDYFVGLKQMMIVKVISKKRNIKMTDYSQSFYF